MRCNNSSNAGAARAKVRQAIAHAVDKNYLLDKADFGLGKVVTNDTYLNVRLSDAIQLRAGKFKVDEIEVNTTYKKKSVSMDLSGIGGTWKSRTTVASSPRPLTIAYLLKPHVANQPAGPDGSRFCGKVRYGVDGSLRNHRGWTAIHPAFRNCCREWFGRPAAP